MSTSLPGRKTGSSTYLACFFWSQATSGSFGSSLPRSGSSAEQFSACSACCCTAGSVLCRVRLASWMAACCSAALPPGCAFGGPGAGAFGTSCTTLRKFSSAVWPSCLACSPPAPGTVITRFEPSWLTSEPLMPIPLTRVSMICRAWSRDSLGGGWPFGVRAVSVTRVPPCRSMPSFGEGLWSPVKNTSAYNAPTITAKITR